MLSSLSQRLRIVCSLGATLLVPALAMAQTGGISGSVTGSGPATVSIYDSAEGLVTSTNAFGVYSISGLAPGTYYAFAAYSGNVTGTGRPVNVLYPNVQCVGSAQRFSGTYCRVNSGTPITVLANVVTPGIDLDLAVFRIGHPAL